MAVLAVVASCSTTTTTTTTTTSSLVGSTTTTVPRDTTTTATPTESTGAAGSTTTAPTGDGGVALPNDLERATGTGTVTVDETTYDVEPVACGWASDQGSSSKVPLEAEDNTRHEFRLVAAAAVEDGAFLIDLDLDIAVGATFIFVVRAVPSDLPGNYVWANERQPSDAVIVTGNHIQSDGALTVLEDTADLYSTRHDVTFDITCDTFGGVYSDLTAAVSEVTGISIPVPDVSGEGTITIDGIEYRVTTTTCDRSGGDVEFAAESADGDVMVSLLLNALTDVVFVQVGGDRMIRDSGVDVIDEGGRLRSPGPIALSDQFSGAPAAVVTFDVACG